MLINTSNLKRAPLIPQHYILTYTIESNFMNNDVFIPKVLFRNYVTLGWSREGSNYEAAIRNIVIIAYTINNEVTLHEN